MVWLSIENTLLSAALLPLAGFFILIFGGARFGRGGRGAGVVSAALAVGSCVLAAACLILWVAHNSFNQPHDVWAFTFRWITLAPSGPDSPVSAITGGVLIDSLSVALFVMLTFMSVVTHLFALGSMPRRTGLPRFYAFLQLLNFALFGLLLSNSLPQLFIFWELLGVAAYFLVQSVPVALHTPSLRRAGLRMFVMHAVGSAAFLWGIGIFFFHTGDLTRLGLMDEGGTSILVAGVRKTLQVDSSEFLFYTGDGFQEIHWLTWCGICFLVAALARMGQFPLFHWVHSAAEAPAPVTALLLGTTFLSAGVILLARIFPIYTLDARFITAVVGCVTLAAGALITLAQNDIRKLLAWSTVSQGGYILLFLGAGGYTTGILQLFTHAFFKTALFLAAGAVLQGLGTADLRQMGGLWRRFPITAAASLLAVFALAGVPWLSGAYSTTLGLACVYDYAQALPSRSGMLLYWIPAGMTYVTAWGIGRWWWLAFAGESRNPKLLEKAGESGFLTLPIIILAGFSVGGWFEFSGILPLIAKSIPPTLGHPGAGGLIIGEYPSYPHVILFTGWAFLGLALAAILGMGTHPLASRLGRFRVVGIFIFWVRERMFFDALLEWVPWAMIRGAVRIVGFFERFVEGVLRTFVRIVTKPMRLIAAIERPETVAVDPTLPAEE